MGAEGASPLTDLHTHILPGVDDGAADLAEALDMARAALADGIHTMAATPHHLHLPPGMDGAALAARVAALQCRLELEGLPLRVVAGVEAALIAALPQQLDAGLICPLNGSRYLLLEPPVNCLCAQVQELVFQVQVRGYTPILAHPERSAAFAHDAEGLYALVERGVLVQITAASLEGGFGHAVQEMARRLLRARLVHVIASDAHDAHYRPPRLSHAEVLAAGLIGDERAHALVATNPAAILAGRPLEVEPPQPLVRWPWQRSAPRPPRL